MTKLSHAVLPLVKRACDRTLLGGWESLVGLLSFGLVVLAFLLATVHNRDLATELPKPYGHSAANPDRFPRLIRLWIERDTSSTEECGSSGRGISDTSTRPIPACIAPAPWASFRRRTCSNASATPYPDDSATACSCSTTRPWSVVGQLAGPARDAHGSSDGGPCRPGVCTGGRLRGDLDLPGQTLVLLGDPFHDHGLGLRGLFLLFEDVRSKRDGPWPWLDVLRGLCVFCLTYTEWLVGGFLIVA